MAVIISLVVTACGGGGYSDDLRSGFMNGCEPSVGTEFCECALAEIEKAFTEEEFIEMDRPFPTSPGESAAALDAAIEPCKALLGG